MKKLIYSLALAGGLILLGTGLVMAQNPVQKKAPSTQNTTSGFVDSNNDGVCDNYDGVRAGQGKGPGNGQCLGRSTGKGLGKGQGLKDGSGLGQRRLDGSGGGRYRGNGQQLRDGTGPNCNVPSK
jgi:hypothetical protein